MLSAQLVSHVLPGPLCRMGPLKMRKTREDINKFIQEYEQPLHEKYSDLLEGQDCSPSVSCLDQAAWGILDGAVAAGGVSVSNVISQVLAVVYSTDKSNPAGGPLDYKPEQASNLLFWYSLHGLCVLPARV